MIKIIEVLNLNKSAILPESLFYGFMIHLHHWNMWRGAELPSRDGIAHEVKFLLKTGGICARTLKSFTWLSVPTVAQQLFPKTEPHWRGPPRAHYRYVHLRIPFIYPMLPSHLPLLNLQNDFGFNFPKKERHQLKWREKRKLILGFWSSEEWGELALPGGLKEKRDFQGRDISALNAVSRNHWALETWLNCQELGRWESWRLAIWCSTWFNKSQWEEGREITLMVPFHGEIPSLLWAFEGCAPRSALRSPRTP